MRKKLTAISEPQIPSKVDSEKSKPTKQNSVFTIFGEQVILGGKKKLLRTTSEVGKLGQKGQFEPSKHFLRTNSDLGRPAANIGPLTSAAIGHGQPFIGTTLVHERPSIKPASHATEKRGYEEVAVTQMVATDTGVRRSAAKNTEDDEIFESLQAFYTAQSSTDFLPTAKVSGSTKGRSTPTHNPPPPPPKPVGNKVRTFAKVANVRLVIWNQTFVESKEDFIFLPFYKYYITVHTFLKPVIVNYLIGNLCYLFFWA